MMPSQDLLSWETHTGMVWFVANSNSIIAACCTIHCTYMMHCRICMIMLSKELVHSLVYNSWYFLVLQGYSIHEDE